MKKQLILLSVIYVIAVSLCHAQIPTAGLIAAYPFSGNAADSSGNGNNGTVHGATLTQDRFGNTNSAYLFDGSSAYISVPDAVSLRLSQTDFTISVWAYETARNVNNEDAIITKRLSSSQSGYNFGINGTSGSADGPAGSVVWVESIGSDPLSNSTGLVSLDQWTNIVIQYSLATHTVNTYLNGTLNTTTTGIPTPSSTETSPMLIGYDSNGDPYYFNGAIDDIYIYDRALSDSDIQLLYTFGTAQTGIIEVASAGHMSISPNPASTAATISLGSPAYGATIKVLDMTGQIILQKTNQSGGKFTLDLSGIQTGIYLIEVSQQKSVWMGKLVKAD